MLSFYSVHAPLETTQRLWKKYRDKAANQPQVAPRFKIDRTLPVRQVQDHPVYAGMMESMDSAVGIVMKQLQLSGIADKTVVIFTSDNGGVSSGDAYATSNLPLRGGKGRNGKAAFVHHFTSLLLASVHQEAPVSFRSPALICIQRCCLSQVCRKCPTLMRMVLI